MTPDQIEAELRSGKYVRDLSWVPNLTPAFVRHVSEQLDDDALTTAAFTQMAYRKWGAQIRVQKEVSDDLLISDITDVTFHEVPWPAKAVELFFEDPQLPSAVLAKVSVPELESLGDLRVVTRPGEVDRLNEERVLLYMENAKGGALVFNLVESLWPSVIHGTESVTMKGAVPLESTENLVLREMIRLAIKVFAYAALPRYKPAPVGVITKAMGGKPGFKGRPNRPARRIVYLPAVHTQREEHDSTGEGKHVTPHTRRGHFRIYRHDKWKNMKGKMLFIAPTRVKGGASTPTTFVVRKPSKI